MKFTARYPRDNVNVSKTHPLTELAWMLGGLASIGVLLFVVLGLATDLAVERIPPRLETWLGSQALEQFSGQDSPALEQRLQKILAKLPADSILRNYQFHIFLDKRADVNAVALPGGTIVVFAGLLRQVESENELTMILAHELGHFAHRDHLRGLGRGLGVTVASALLFGKDNAASDLLAKSLLSVQSQYSKAQEQAADSFGLTMLERVYGNCSGATTFFARLARERKSRLPYLLASHPHPQNRIDSLNREIKANSCPLEQVLPVQADLQALIAASTN